MQRRSVPRTDPRYNQIRTKNNDSVKKSREKSRRERDETVSAINELEDENEQLTERIQLLKQEYQQLQDLFKQYTGIPIDQLLTSETKSNSESTCSTSLNPPKVEEPTNNTSKPLLTINTYEEKVATTPSSSTNTDLDAADLDGAIVLINGVQYKIVSMNKTSD